MQNNPKLNLANLILVAILISTSFIWANHNDFMYYGSAVANGKLYQDIYFSYLPGSFFFNKLISLLFPSDYNYFLMRISSIVFFVLSINILANSFLKKYESKCYFLILTSFLCSSAALEIGSNTLSFLFFALSLTKFYFGKKNRDFFFGGIFFGLCIITRPTYIFCALVFLIIILKKKYYNKYLLFSVIGGLISILPYLFYLLKDFNTVIFWNLKIHAIHNEIYRWNGFLPFARSVLSRLYHDYIVILPLLLNYLYYLYKNTYKRFSELTLLATLTASSLTVLIVHKQYFEPLFIIILLLIIKHIKFSNLSRFLIISIIIISTVKFLDTYKNLDKNKYSYKNINSFFSILNSKKEIQSVIDNNVKKECNLVFRTTSPIYLPYTSIQHPFNLQGVWLFRIKENLIIQSNKFFDYNNFLNFSKKDFNAILVGYYPLNEYELKLINYAEKENWNFFYTTNFKIFINNECN
jgi:hypothetical protein